jgi:hypothetical protein
MTDAEFDIITKWQASPPGRAFDRICTLGAAIADLRELLLHRDGVVDVREHIKALIEYREQMNDLIADVSPKPTIILAAE